MSDAKEKIQRVLSDKGTTQAALAAQMGVSQATISQWLNGTYRGDLSALDGKAEGWLRQQETRKTAAFWGGPGFVETLAARRIATALLFAQTTTDLVVVYGPSGVGKTMACQQFCRSYGNVWLATMSSATTSTVTCLEEICVAVGLEPAGGAAKMQRLLIKRLRETRGLLLVDEAQHLSVGALEAIRALHDAAELAVALVGNEQVYARLTGGNRQAQFAQLFSRVGKRVALGRPMPEDVDVLTAAWGLEEAGLKAVVGRIAATPGGLRSATKALRLAFALAQGAGKPLSEQHLEMAWKDLGCRVDKEG